MNLTKDGILAADDLGRETVEVPEWGGTVTLRGLTAFERERWGERWASRDEREGLVMASLVAACAMDADGKPLFAEADVETLARKSAAAVTRLWRVARDLCGMGEEDAKNR